MSLGHYGAGWTFKKPDGSVAVYFSNNAGRGAEFLAPFLVFASVRHEQFMVSSNIGRPVEQELNIVTL